MKTFLFNAVAAATLTLPLVFATAQAAPRVDAAAPAFAVETIAGETLSSDALKGQMVILEWTNHDCPFVRKHYGADNMQHTQETTQDMDAVWVTVVSSAPGTQGYVTPEQAQALTTSRGATPTHVVLDPSGDLGRLYAAKTTPHMFVIDEAGMLSYAGAIDSIPSADPADIAEAQNYVLAAANAIEAGEAVTPKQTKPYGCSVKYK